MTRLVAVDEVSGMATLEAGLLGPEAEALLAEHGFTLGHFPQSFQYASIGGFAATRSSGQSSAGYGRFDSLVMALKVATPLGDLELGSVAGQRRRPRPARAGHGLGGRLRRHHRGDPQVRPVPPDSVYEAWRFPSFTAGADAMRHARPGPGPAHGAPPLGRVRDRGQPGQPGRGRRVGGRRAAA